MGTPFKLVFVTGNHYKLNDAHIVLGDAVVLESVDLDLPEIQGTIEEIATEKCRRAAQILQKPVLIDDTSLCFDAMGELPGPYIKWFLQALGNEKLHKMLDGFEDKSAQFVCTLACSLGPDQEVVLFQERTTGKIIPARGPTSGKTWIPNFEVNGSTFHEMSIEERHHNGARGRALARLNKWLLGSKSTG